MITWVRHSQAGQSLLALALGLALALRIMMPPGFMPAATPQGMLIQLCSGLDIAVQIPAGAPAGEKHDAADRPCVFAAGLDHGALPVPPPAALALLLGVSSMPAAARPEAPRIARLAAPPPPSHAPPALA
ncbi:MAG: hypothetical protein B7Y82_12285 [Sphingomonadales bacterium 32-65-25]|jgi:hypothetical protein|nr:MAG: hypothetical protein B7Y82_12285 [Sphingomonadales bacterium 32-65-25]